MGPKLFAYVDKAGRPVTVVVLQLLFGCLAFINVAPNGSDIFTWLLSLSGLSILFIYGSIAVAHIRFRMAWKAQGHSLDEIPYKAAFGVWGSYLCLLINVVALMAQFYVALYPIGSASLSAETFFQDYLAGPFLLVLYLGWKIYSWFARPDHRPLWIPIKDIDIYKGLRLPDQTIEGVAVDDLPDEKKKKGIKDWAAAGLRTII